MPRSLALALPWILVAGLAEAQPIPSAPPAPPSEPDASPSLRSPPAPPSPEAGLQLQAPAWPSASARPRSNVRARLQLLDQTLIPMAERSHDARVPSAVGNLVAGAVLATLGGFVYDSAAPSNATSTMLIALGGFEVASGIVQLAWPPARERLTSQYRALPRRTAADRRAAMRFGEEAFEDIAADGTRRRVLNFLLTVGLSAASIGIIYNRQIFAGEPWPDPPAGNYLVVGLLSVGAVLGLVGLFTRSEEERQRDIWRSQLELQNTSGPGAR